MSLFGIKSSAAKRFASVSIDSLGCKCMMMWPNSCGERKPLLRSASASAFTKKRGCHLAIELHRINVTSAKWKPEHETAGRFDNSNQILNGAPRPVSKRPWSFGQRLLRRSPTRRCRSPGSRWAYLPIRLEAALGMKAHKTFACAQAGACFLRGSFRTLAIENHAQSQSVVMLVLKEK